MTKENEMETDAETIVREAMLQGIVNQVMATLNTIPDELNELLRESGNFVMMLDYLTKNPQVGLRVEFNVYHSYVELAFSTYDHMLYRLILRRGQL